MRHTFIIAEAGINHNGDLEVAKNLVSAANEAGCDAIKFQTYQTELRVEKDSDIYDLLKRCELSYQETAELKMFADKTGIEFFSTPFDEHSLAFLVETLGIRRIKLASFDVTNKKFLDLVNECAKRYVSLKVILSTGMSNPAEIVDAVETLSNVQSLTLLHCVSSYPTPEKDVNLGAIRSLSYMARSPRDIGYSDHTNDILVPALAVLAGANTIEKHFTLDLNGPGVDNSVSADPEMMKDMVDAIREHERFLGDGVLEMKKIEEPTTAYRRYS